MCKVSVIVPTYNSISYIEECINSILEQELQEIEVLIVDAGSIDGTAEYVEKIQDERVRLVTSSMKSYGHQVNLGISEARAKYVAIVESDDCITKEGLLQCYEKAKTFELDIIKADFMIFVTNKNGKKYLKKMEMFSGNKKSFYEKIIHIDMYPELLQKDRYLWKGLYRKEFLLENGVLLNETAGAAFQDVGFLFHTLTAARRIMYTRDFMYCYRKDNDSSSVYNVKGVDYLANEFSFLLNRMEELYGEEWNKYLPYVYVTLMQMTNTRHRLFSLMNVETKPNEESIQRIAGMLQEAIKGDRLNEGYIQTVRRDTELFVADYDGYYRMIQKEMQAVKAEYELFMNRVFTTKSLVLCGMCAASGMLEMLLCKEGYTGEIIKCDADEKKVFGEIKLLDEAIKKSNRDDIFVICNMDFKYELKYELLQKYKIQEDRILFYELGGMQYLLKCVTRS